MTYIKCDDEDELIKRFLVFWEDTKPDVITGWNTRFYDLPYLIHRIKVRFGEKEIKRLSPLEICIQRFNLQDG